MWTVVFDTSAYKGTGDERLSRLMAAERSAGVLALASAPVAQELLSHVLDASPRSRSSARAAVRRLGRHCASFRDDRTDVQFISHTDAQLFRLLAGREHSNDRALFAQMGALIGDVCQAPIGAPLDALELIIAEMAEHVNRMELQFVEQLEADAAGDQFDRANRMKRNFRWVERRLQRVLVLYQLQVTPAQQVQRILDVLKLTELAFLVFDDDLATVRANPGTHTARRNSLWDIEIVAATSVSSTFAGRRIVVVTEERRLRRVAGDAGYSDLVLGVAEYEQLLGLNQWMKPGQPPSSGEGGETAAGDIH